MRGPPALTSVGRDVLVQVGTGTCATLACLQEGGALPETGELSCYVCSGCDTPRRRPSQPPLPPPSPPRPSPPPPRSPQVNCEESATISDTDSYAAARQCVTIVGNLTVAPAFSGPLLDLLLLRAVGGTFQLSSNAQLTSVSMPLLSSIGGDFLVQFNERLTTLDLPQIVSVSLSLVVTRNAQLETLSSFNIFPRFLG